MLTDEKNLIEDVTSLIEGTHQDYNETEPAKIAARIIEEVRAYDAQNWRNRVLRRSW